MKNMFAVAGVVVLVVVAGVGGFFAGNSFGPNAQAQSVQREFFAQRFGNGGQGGAGQFGPGGQGAGKTLKGVRMVRVARRLVAPLPSVP